MLETNNYNKVISVILNGLNFS